MKLVSKVGHYRIILRHGMPAEPITGRAAVPGLYVLFKDGAATVNDEEMIELIKKHPKFGSEFVLSDDEGIDPYSQARVNSEPEHKIMGIKHGSVEGVINAKTKVNLPPERLAEIDEAINARAMKMAAVMAKSMVKDILVEMNKDNKEKTKGKPGRPKKIKEDEDIAIDNNDQTIEENKTIEIKE